MTDPDLIAKKLAQIETCVEQLRSLSQPARIATDVREERFVEHTLQIAWWTCSNSCATWSSNVWAICSNLSQ